MPACILCGAVASQLKLDRKYYHCSRCDLIYLDRAHLPGLEEERQRYLQHDNTAGCPGYVRMFEQFLTAIRPALGRPGRALDFGCGPGPVLAAMLRQQGWDTDTYDPLFFPGSIEGEQYDLITATEVLEHVHTPLPVWRQLARLLRPRGVLAIMTHFHPGPASFSAWWYRRDPTHVTFYSAATMDWVGNTLGLAVRVLNSKNTVVFLARE